MYKISMISGKNKARLRNRAAFTLVELLLGLMVSAIVMTAVATLIFAVGKANESAGDTSRTQAQLRYATLRVTDLVRNCLLVCKTADDQIALWRADDNNDRSINLNEVIYLEASSGNDAVELIQYTCPNWLLAMKIQPVWFSGDSVRIILDQYCTKQSIVLMDGCSNIEFLVDTDSPYTQFVALKFNIQENQISRSYEISSSVRCRAINLLDQSGQLIEQDDD